MNAATISNDVALRIGLAARELPDTDAAGLLRVLAGAIEFPPTPQKLSALTVKSLKDAAGGELADLDIEVIKSALRYLKGESGISADPLPAIEPYTDGDMPGSIRVACASNKAEMLDGHFGSCRRFLVYQVSASAARLIDIREADAEAEVEDKNTYRASLIGDSQILFVASIGGPAAAKVVRSGAHPIKKPDVGPARDAISELQQTLAQDAPPWLAKVMGQAPEQRIRFSHEAGA
jgi:nitrogen fixation protein NifX